MLSRDTMIPSNRISTQFQHRSDSNKGSSDIAIYLSLISGFLGHKLKI